MAVFQSRKYPSAGGSNTFGARYRAMMAKRPFLLFGLPFMSVIVAASFVLTPATAIRYERHDRKVRQMTREEELGVGRAGRKVDIREEYYVNTPFSLCFLSFPSSFAPFLFPAFRSFSFLVCSRGFCRWCGTFWLTVFP